MTGSCTICGLEGPTGRSGDGHQQDCRRCGPYVISGTARAMIGSRLEDDPVSWARASHAIRRQTSRDEWLRVGSHLVDALTTARLPTPDVQLRNLLERVAEEAGENALTLVAIDHDDLAGFVGVSDEESLEATAQHAIGAGLLVAQDGKLALTHSGWVSIQPPREAARGAEESGATPGPAPPSRVEQAPCPQCDGQRTSDVVAEYDERIDGGDGMTSAYVSVRTLRCRGCGTLSVVRDDSFSEDEDHVQDQRTGEWVAVPVVTTTRWPEPRVRARPAWLATLADETARSLADEVYRALAANISTLAAMGVRALLDRTFELAGAEPGADFGAKLRQLRERGVLGGGETETMRVVTDAGSAAGHRGWRPEPDELDTILDAAEALLHRIAVQPGRTERLRVAVPPRPARRRAPPT